MCLLTCITLVYQRSVVWYTSSCIGTRANFYLRLLKRYDHNVSIILRCTSTAQSVSRVSRVHTVQYTDPRKSSYHDVITKQSHVALATFKMELLPKKKYNIRPCQYRACIKRGCSQLRCCVTHRRSNAHLINVLVQAIHKKKTLFILGAKKLQGSCKEKQIRR